MSGVSLPTGFGGLGQTFGMTGGQANFNPTTTAAVSDNKGGLKAFDPSSMAETRAPGPKPEAIARPAGYDSSGLPDWQANWLQNGGTAAVPQMMTGSGAAPTWGKGSSDPTPPGQPVKQVGVGAYGGAANKGPTAQTMATSVKPAPEPVAAAAGPGGSAVNPNMNLIPGLQYVAPSPGNPYAYYLDPKTGARYPVAATGSYQQPSQSYSNTGSNSGPQGSAA